MGMRGLLLLLVASFGCGAPHHRDAPGRWPAGDANGAPPWLAADATVPGDAGPVGGDAAHRGDSDPGAGDVAISPGDGASPSLGDDAAGRLDDPAAPGPWVAGVETVSLTDPSRNRTFAVDIWYPVDPAAPDGSDNEYDLETPFGTIFSMQTPARRDATMAPGGPWPLVIFSHGYGGVRFQSHFLTEHLASHGFIVAAPDHPGNTLVSAFLGGDAAQSAIDRPLDVIFTLDFMLAESGYSIDPDRIGISGHSFGGWTTFEAASRDERFAVLFPLAPGFKQGATPDFVADIHRPMCIFGGSEDGTTPFDSDQRAPYDLAASPRFLVKILGAGHLDFSNLCDVPLMPLFLDDGCKPANIPPADVHARVRTIATAFARRYLAGETGYDAYLASDYVVGLGDVEYWSER